MVINFDDIDFSIPSVFACFDKEPSADGLSEDYCCAQEHWEQDRKYYYSACESVRSEGFGTAADIYLSRVQNGRVGQLCDRQQAVATEPAVAQYRKSVHSV